MDGHPDKNKRNVDASSGMIDVFKNQSKAIKGTALASEDTVNSANSKALSNGQ